MNLQTNIPLQPASNPFGYENKLVLLGSCFAENIGEKLTYSKFQSVVNPYGILFHPLAIERVLQDACRDENYGEETIFELEGVWKSFIAHSRLNSHTKGAMIDTLIEVQSQLKKALKEASHIFITLGTAWVYQHKETGIAVANCHKVPQKQFIKGLLPIEEITASLTRQCTIIRHLNPKAQITFTVSPVRHLKDGFVENTRSKAHLISAVHEVCITQKTYYFPAYELMMDELRDYRFYASDMLHPSQQAIDYIWEKFLEVYAGVYTEPSRSTKAKTTLKEVQAIQQGLTHRPFHPESKQHREFLGKLEKRIVALQKEYPHITFD
ncbi:GSCFA domain-containing protein [uncultured Dokdonia sp.]|uniref:GSCFA domain-containing protein n=1 Tax=uncultured Dokdonia sp. TaxID=575653 RepID=UPI002610E0E3|nr:GSCFA domain-containing protein [uncultured Dokdonia sp.]